MIVEAKYILKDEVTSRLEALEKKFVHFDHTLAKTDNKVKGFGKGNGLANIIPSGGKLEKGIGMLNEIPNLNTGILSSAMGIANPYVLAGTAVVAFGALAVDATQMANEWNIGMSKANVTIGATPQGLKEISEKLQNMKRYGADMMTIPDSFEKIISGVGDVTKAMDIMEVSLKSARANSASVDVTGDAIVNIMGSAGKQFQNATQISDMLTKTKILGKAEFEDMATYLPRVIPYANQLGISVNEVAGSMALLTAKGQTTEQTTMLLQNAFVALADPKKRGNIEKFVKVFDHGKIRPFVDILGDMKTKMKSLNDEGRLKFLGALDLDSQAASSFQQLIDNTDLLKSNIQELGNATGATNKALSDSHNASDGIARIKEKWDNLKMKLGQKIAPFWEKIVTGVANLWDWLEKVEKKTGYFSMAWKIVASVFKLAWSPIARIWNIGKAVYGVYERMSNFMAEKFPRTFQVVGIIIKGVTAIFRDLFFTVSETYDMLANLVSLDFDAMGKNIDNFKSHKYMNMADPTPAPMSPDQGKAVYENLIKQGIPKDKLDAMAKKMGIVIPSNATKPVASTMPMMPDAPEADALTKSKNKKHADRAERTLREVAGAGSQIRNVTIHIAKQIENVEVTTTNMQDVGIKKIKKILEELLVTSVRDAEIALA